MANVDVSQNDQDVVCRVIRSFFPEAKLLVFGSRIDGRARQYSDLDIALDVGQKISLPKLALLEEALSQTQITFKVDITDLHSVSSDFKKHILSNYVVW